MTPKEKAEKLIIMFWFGTDLPTSKKPALIMCDEIISILQTVHKPEYTAFYFNDSPMDGYELIHYWEQVKTELEKI